MFTKFPKQFVKKKEIHLHLYFRFVLLNSTQTWVILFTNSMLVDQDGHANTIYRQDFKLSHAEYVVTNE